MMQEVVTRSLCKLLLASPYVVYQRGSNRLTFQQFFTSITVIAERLQVVLPSKQWPENSLMNDESKSQRHFSNKSLLRTKDSLVMLFDLKNLSVNFLRYQESNLHHVSYRLQFGLVYQLRPLRKPAGVDNVCTLISDVLLTSLSRRHRSLITLFSRPFEAISILRNSF